MLSIIDQLQLYKKYKRNFSKKFGANETTVQKCVDELLNIAYAHTNLLRPEDVVDFIDNNECQLKKIFDFYNPQTSEEKVYIINELLRMIPILIGSNNTIYTIQTEATG